MPFESPRIADTEPAPTHQQGHGAKPGLIRLHISAAAIAPANVGSIDDPFEFLRRKVVGWDLYDLDLPETDGGILGEVAASYAGPKEPNHSALLFLLGEGTVFPGVAEVQQSVQLQFIQVFDPLDTRPDKKLFAEDGFEFFEGRGFDAAAYGIGQVCFHCLSHRNPWPRFGYAWFRDFRTGRRRGIGRSGDWRRRTGRDRGAERRQALDERLLKLDAHIFGLGPLSSFGALAKVISVDLAADPLGAIAAPAGTVS